MSRPEKHHLDRFAAKIATEVAAGGDPDQLLNTPKTAVLLSVSEQFLEIGRVKGFGPPFVALSPRRIRYRRGDVLEWLHSRTHRSTAEYEHSVTSGARKAGDRVVAGKLVRAGQ